MNSAKMGPLCTREIFSRVNVMAKDAISFRATSSFMMGILLKIPDTVMELNSGKMVRRSTREILNSVPDMAKGRFFRQTRKCFLMEFLKKESLMAKGKNIVSTAPWHLKVSLSKEREQGVDWFLERMAANFSMEILSKAVARVREQNTAKMETFFSAVHFSKINAMG